MSVATNSLVHAYILDSLAARLEQNIRMELAVTSGVYPANIPDAEVLARISELHHMGLLLSHVLEED